MRIDVKKSRFRYILNATFNIVIMEGERYKSRKEIATELGVSRKTLYNIFKKNEILISSGLISPSDQDLIYQHLRKPKQENSKPNSGDM